LGRHQHINALDAIQRAVSKVRAHEALRDDLAGGSTPRAWPAASSAAPSGAIADALRFAEEVAADLR